MERVNRKSAYYYYTGALKSYYTPSFSRRSCLNKTRVNYTLLISKFPLLKKFIAKTFCHNRNGAESTIFSRFCAGLRVFKYQNCKCYWSTTKVDKTFFHINLKVLSCISLFFSSWRSNRMQNKHQKRCAITYERTCISLSCKNAWFSLQRKTQRSKAGQDVAPVNMATMRMCDMISYNPITNPMV